MLLSWWSRRRIEPIELAREFAHTKGARAGVLIEGEELPAVSVIVPTYNRREELRHVLDALAAQEYPRDRLEVVVVDDGSEDGTAEMVRTAELPYRVRLLQQENQGVAIARIRGALEAGVPPSSRRRHPAPSPRSWWCMHARIGMVETASHSGIALRRYRRGDCGQWR